MDPEYSRIIGLEVVTDNLFETDAIREFLQKEQASVGRKFVTIHGLTFSYLWRSC